MPPRINPRITLLEEDVVLTRLFPVGGFDWGWNKDAAEEMTTEDGVIYTWRGTIWGGADFKFLCQKDTWSPGYTRDGEAEDYWTLVYNDGSLPDTQFQVSETGTYIITINLETLKIKVRKAEDSPTLYLIGGGFDWGWSLADAQAMTTEDGITYTWTGNMWGNADFKILCQNDAWAPGYNRDASAEDYWTMVYRATEADPDVQFQVAENGEHTITVNIETMKMTVTKPEPKPEYPKIYPVGGIEDWGWDLSKIQPMETEDGIRFVQSLGCTVVQAHPFRNHCMIVPPGILDGIEIFNGHPGHDSRNDIATYWAEKFDYKIRTGGSDFHGDAKPGISLGTGRGDLVVPYRYYEELQKIRI